MLEARLKSIIQYQMAWRQRYEQSLQLWSQEQEDGGAYYDVGEELTTLESTQAQLEEADDVWLTRGNGFRSEDLRQDEPEFQSLTVKLGALQDCIVSAEDRWQQRGDGFRTVAQHEDHLTHHTVDNVGGVDARLSNLNDAQKIWQERHREREETDTAYHVARQAEIRAEQEERARVEEEARLAAEAKRAEAARIAAEERRRKREEAEEDRRRREVRERMKKHSEAVKGIGKTTGQKRREEQAERDRREQEDAKARARAKAKEEAAARKRAEREQKARRAKMRAAKFMGKMM